MHIGNLDRLVERNFTSIWDFQAHNDFHKGGFAGAIDADQSYFLSLGNAKRDIGKKLAFTESLTKIVNRKVIHAAKVGKRRQKEGLES